MPATYDEQTGQWVYEDPLQPLQKANQQMLRQPGQSPLEQSQQLFKAQGVQGEEALANPVDPKPFIAQGPGQAVSEVGRQVLNSGGALVTDYMDLASYIGDTAVGLGNLAQGKSFNEGGHFMDDSDNPWTQYRLNALEPETQVGMAARPIIRLGVALLTLPKLAIQGVLTPLKVLSKAPVVGGVAGKGLKGVQGLDAAADAFRTVDGTSDALKALTGLKGALPKGKAAGFANNLTKTPWLYATYDDVAKGIDAGKNLTGVKSWMDSVRSSTSALTNLSKLSNKAKIQTVGQALAWDAFVAWNAAGEGDQLSDETFSDMLAMTNSPFLQAVGTPLATAAEDDALTRKAKQMIEGTAMGGLLNGVFDMWRVFRFAENYKAAGPGVKGKILEAFAERSQDIGDGLGGQLQTFARGGTEFAGGGYNVLDPQRPLPQSDPAMDPWSRGGALARLSDVQLQARTTADAPLPQVDSPVQNRLAQMEGLASPLNDDPLYQEWLQSRAPREAEPDVMPPSAGGNAVAEQFATQGAMPTPDDTRAYKAWLEEKARMPEGELDPRVQESLMGLEAAQPSVRARAQSPVFTPQEIRQAFYQDLYASGGENVEELTQAVKRLMPEARTDKVQYLLDNPGSFNGLGLENGVDSIWRNDLYNQGLLEGWAEVDPETMNIVLKRSAARELDQGQLLTRKADALDEAVDVQQFDEAITETPVDVGESFRAAQQEQPLEIDQAQSLKVAEAELADPALANAEQNLAKATQDLVEYDLGEEMRLIESTQQAMKGELGDAEVVREMLGEDLDQIPALEVRKAETGRGWEVIGDDGDPIGRASTKRAAQKLADQQLAADRQALVNRARQQLTENAGQVIEVGGAPVRSPDVMGKVTLTKAQINELTRYPEFKSFWDQFGVGKRTFEFSHQDMLDLQDGFKALMQTGEIEPNRLRVLRNLADKLDTATKLIAPQARAQQFAADVASDAEQFLRKGEICDFLD